MLKKRLIFVLYYDSGIFCLSRNFRLQKVGDHSWLFNKFRFGSIGSYVDELVLLDVTRSSDHSAFIPKDKRFVDALSHLMSETFVPLTIGGALRGMSDVQKCFELGADKVLFNTPVVSQPDLVRQCVSAYGSQAVVAQIDATLCEDGYVTRISNNEVPALSISEHLDLAIDLGVGEIIVNSIDQDGTGAGFDMDLISQCTGLPVPLIVAGGAGKPEHFAQVLSISSVDAAATGNLFNFVGAGFENVRSYLSAQGLPVRPLNDLSRSKK